MRLLLDSHALLWFASGDPRLPRHARAAIAGADAAFVSAASAWEIATKARLGRLPAAGPLATDFLNQVRGQGFRAISVHPQDAQDAGNLAGTHQDPFDRMLVAQALRRGLVLVSNETLFDQYGVTRLWT